MIEWYVYKERKCQIFWWDENQNHKTEKCVLMTNAKNYIEIHQLIRWSIICIFDSMRPSDAYMRQ